MGRINIKRVYELPAKTDGYRVLVDRLWPRGIKKEAAALDEWNKLLPPSSELRKWFNHIPERFNDFKKAYTKELLSHPEELQRLRAIAKRQNVTLLYSAKDTQMNQAVVLQQVLSKPR